MRSSHTAFSGRIVDAALIVLMVFCLPHVSNAACLGDINHDGKVDTSDAAIMKGEIGQTGCSANRCRSDLNADGAVDGTDEKILLAEIGRRDCQAEEADMPEPDTNVSRPVFGNAGRLEDQRQALTEDVRETLPERAEPPPDSGGEDAESTEESGLQKTRFHDNSDGTITDPSTGLMWTRNANLPAETMLFYDALHYIEEMNRGNLPNFGYTDWRLPTLEELQGFIDYTSYTTRGHNLTPGHPFKNVQMNQYGNYPIGSVYSWTSDTAWLFSLYCRVVGRNVGSCLGYVWPVRNCK
jgi:hypothetical protein